MPEGVGYGPQNTASAGLNLNIVGSHAYAYSGEQTTTNTVEKSFLEFTTGNYLTELWLQYGSASGGGVDVKARAYLNGTTMIEVIHAANYDENQDAKIPMRLIIPSYTLFKFTLQGQSTQTSDWSVWATGRIHGKIE